MTLSPLTAISPIDGRYHRQTENLGNYLSEMALIRYRVKVEVEYFISLSEEGIFQLEIDPEKLRDLYRNFGETEAKRIKETERVTNHDVKAVEYFIKEEFEKLGLESVSEFVHFGLTSQDINNTATPMMLQNSLLDVYIPALDGIIADLRTRATDWAEIPMLARTHGQPASPTRLGKEFQVYVDRLYGQLALLRQVPVSGKFGGATGNFNAHHIAYPDTDWVRFANDFLKKSLGLDRAQVTTQIDHYDNLAATFDALKRINTILLDLSRDIWSYVSMNYFKQRIKEGEIGSSAMPHKVNPIDFENAEGNLGLANALFEHMAAKLPISRLQRDLTDSTVLRNIGVPLAHTMIALNSITKGLGKLQLNEAAVKKDLEDNWAVVAEAIQTVLRREGFPKPYEALKALTRTNEAVTEASIHAFIKGLEVSDEVKKELLLISPFNYTGIRFY